MMWVAGKILMFSLKKWLGQQGRVKTVSQGVKTLM